MLVLISLSTLLRMETVSTERSHTQSEAEQNAIFGLKVALGQLQKLAGPDQRVTAPADIDNTAANGKRHWTGVWMSGTTGGAADADFQGWLVSQPGGVANTLNTRAADDVEWNADSENWVTLVGEGTVESGVQADYVAAGRVAIDDTGHYAYWTGEENTKARVNLSVPEEVAMVDADLMAPRYTGFTHVDAGFGATEPGQTELAKLTSLSDLNNLTGVTDGLDQQYFHDLSLYSRGVQVDVVNGGLKKDLTHLLESDAAFTRHFGLGPTASPVGVWPVPYTFHDADESYTFPYGAPNWGILASYYRLYNDVNNASITPRAPQPAGYKSFAGDTYHSSDEQYQYNQATHAVVSMFRLGISLSYELDPDKSTYKEDGTIDTAVYNPVIFFKPLIALYNPYDVALDATSYYVEWSIKPIITIQVAGQNAVEFRMQEVIPEGDNIGSRFRWTLRGNTALQPGETRYYCLDQLYPFTSANIGDYAQMAPNWNENGAYFVPLVTSPLVVVADREGSTAAEYSSHSSNTQSSKEKSGRFGLTQTEKDRLIITTPPQNDPFITVTISYDPKEVGDDLGSGSVVYETARSPVGVLLLKTTTTSTDGTSQYFSTYFQDYEEDMRPQGVTDWSVPLSGLISNPIDITTLAFGLRTTEQTDEPHRQMIDANPRSMMLAGTEDGYRAGKGLSTVSGWTMREYGLGEAPEPQTYNGIRYSGFWGNTREAIVDGTTTGGAGAVVLFHIPREAMVSLGEFQHANLGRYSHQPAYIFANSYTNSKIPASATRSTYTEYTRTHYAYDWSYAINKALWDSYYFSTLPQDDDEALALLDNIADGTATLPNPRLTPYAPSGYRMDNAALADLLTDDSAEDTADIAAAFQLTEGMFNVNSTSVEAWKALLASNTHLGVPIYSDESGISNNSEHETDAVFFRTPISYDTGFSTDENGRNFWNAYRKLDDAELTDLATALVEEVRTRGPFSSLGDFVNRRPGAADPAQRRRGPLQAALDTEVNTALSRSLIGLTDGEDLTIPDFADDVYNDTDTAGTGMPGWVLQGDLLQAIGPVLSVRSDTFRIRAYGDTVNPITGNVEAQAWCEAIVQRVPDPVMDTAVVPSHEQLTAPPTVFGREFKIIAFRWLDKNAL
ncbi:MAG: hypothetical protein Q7Q73_06335 [Verrucomicrobiota bacterium JB024]|nr:hypothetical protein [Verrucomicrobiota bacterium JB024]